VGQYLQLLTAALASGRAHVTTTMGGEPDSPLAWGWRKTSAGGWEPQGLLVGWLDGAELYLEPVAAYAQAQRLAGEQGESLVVSERTLRRRLHEAKLLSSTGTRGDRVHFTTRKVLGGVRREVLHVSALALSLAHGSAPTAPPGPKPAETPENGALGVGHSDPTPGSVPHGVPHGVPHETGGDGVNGAQGALPGARESAQAEEIEGGVLRDGTWYAPGSEGLTSPF
jgi:hypothetical protein